MGESTRFSRALDDSKAVALTGKIMVVAIIVLFVVVVFVIFLHLYAKWFWRLIGEDEEEEGIDSPSRIRRRTRRSRFVFAPGQDPAAELRRGLDFSALRNLPALVFRAEDFKDGLECAVCLSELADGERARLLPKCNHGFHVDCIDMWFQSHSTCPLCRNSVASEKESAMDSVNVDDLQIGGDSSAAAGESESEIPSFPTNVLFWGDQSQVTSGSPGLEEEGGSANEGVLVIDVPRENPAASSSASGEELKSPVTTRLRSLKRLLSREKRVNPCSSNSVSDVEQGNRAQS